ncbi:MAG: zinc ribbon domain-containing protein [Candidatus Pacebacteria bacterium]|nr:zinc ribbon domain-containing protein [Candidatus Paceibacterota bacterium]
MYCPNCGNKISGNENFCESCGHDLKQKIEVGEIENDTTKPLISINVSKTQTLVFYNSFLIYKGARLNYKDIDGMSYLLTRTKHSINFIPTHTSSAFKIKLESNGKKYEVDSSETSFMFFASKSQKEKEEIFGKLVYILDNLIKPFVLINQLIKYGQGNELKIGDSLIANLKGFFKKRFWRSPEFLPWDQYFNSVLDQGNFHIYKSDPTKKYKLYFTCSMSAMNTVIFPDLLNILFQSNGVVNQEEIKDLEKKKDELVSMEGEKLDSGESSKNYCWSCSAPNEAGQKFCKHCGSKLS